MTQITLLKNIGKYIDKIITYRGDKFKLRNYSIPLKNMGVKSLDDCEAILGMRPGDEDCRYSTRVAYGHLQHSIKNHGYERFNECLNEFKRFMTNNPWIEYRPGDLWATADIGIDNNDIKLFLAFDFDKDGNPAILTMLLDVAYITHEDDEPLDDVISKWGNIWSYKEYGYLHDGWSVSIPEYKWYHLPGKSDMITSCKLDVRNTPLRRDKDEFTSFANITDINNIIIYFRTITSTIGSERVRGIFY
jgi:hypothetical protein